MSRQTVTAFAPVFLRQDGACVMGDLHRTRQCAIDALPLFGDDIVLGIAEVPVEPEHRRLTQMQYRLKYGSAAPLKAEAA